MFLTEQICRNTIMSDLLTTEKASICNLVLPVIRCTLHRASKGSRFCITALHDWLKKPRHLFKTNHNLFQNVFPRFVTARLKVAEHSFQEPMPNSPLLLSYLSFGTRFLQESRLTTDEFILVFWLKMSCCHGNGPS